MAPEAEHFASGAIFELVARVPNLAEVPATDQRWHNPLSLSSIITPAPSTTPQIYFHRQLSYPW